MWSRVFSGLAWKALWLARAVRRLPRHAVRLALRPLHRPLLGLPHAVHAIDPRTGRRRQVLGHGGLLSLAAARLLCSREARRKRVIARLRRLGRLLRLGRRSRPDVLYLQRYAFDRRCAELLTRSPVDAELVGLQSSRSCGLPGIVRVLGASYGEQDITRRFADAHVVDLSGMSRRHLLAYLRLEDRPERGLWLVDENLVEYMR